MSRVALLPHCLLNPSANIIFDLKIQRDLIDLLIKNNFDIIQMPCPELGFYSKGRSKKTRDMYDKSYRKICRTYSEYLVKLLLKLDSDFILIVGLKGSPSCGINHIILGNSWAMRRESRGVGMFIQELKEKVKEYNLNVYFVEYDPKDKEKSLKKIKEVINDA